MEKIIRTSRHDAEEEGITEAEEVLEVEEGDVKELESDNLFENKNAFQIVVNKDVNKEFFEKLKGFLDECPGKDDVELVIGEKVIPIPNKVNWERCLKEKVNNLLDQLK